MIPLLSLIQDTAPPADVPPTQPGFPWVLMLGLLAIFYFLMIRPQMREQKRRREMLSQLKKNDRVVTTGGMYGQIVSIDENEVTLKIDEGSNVRARFTRAAIAGVVQPRGADDGRKELAKG